MDMHIKLPARTCGLPQVSGRCPQINTCNMAMHVLHEAIYIAACGVAGDMAIFEEEPELHTAARQVVTIGPSKLQKGGIG